VPIGHRAGAVLPLVASSTVHRVLRRGEKFEYHTAVPSSVDGPIHYGQRIGRLVIEMRGKPFRTVPLTASLEVPAASVARRTQDALTTPWTLVVFAGMLGALAGLSRLRRRPPPREPRQPRPSRTSEELDPA
jgi:hypothetical protein